MFAEDISEVFPESQKIEDITLPSIQKTLRARKNYWGIIFRGIARNCHNRLRETTLGELLSGRLRIFVVALWFLTVFVACFQELICAMATSSLRQNTSEELFLAGLREIRVIIARNNFWGINCVIISKGRVLDFRVFLDIFVKVFGSLHPLVLAVKPFFQEGKVLFGRAAKGSQSRQNRHVKAELSLSGFWSKSSLKNRGLFLRS